MRTLTTVGIYNDFPARQSSITMWSTDHELSGRVDVVFDVIAEQGLNILRKLSLDTRDNYIHDILLDFCEHDLIICIKIVVLCTYYDCFDTFRTIIVAVLNSYLRFCIWTQIWNLCRFSTNICQSLKDSVT